MEHEQARPPQQAIAYLAAVRNYYKDTEREPRNVDIAAAHIPRLNPRTWDRRKDDLRSGKLGGRDWIEVWPPPKDWVPTWAHQLSLPLEPADNGVVHIVYEDTYDKNGKLLERRLLRTLGHLGAMAAVLSYTALDLNDGQVDQAVHICRLLLMMLHNVIPRVS